MDEKEMLREYSKELIEHAKKIASHCDKQEECTEKCAFYTKYGSHSCLFHTAHYPSYWDFNAVEED